MEKKSLTLREQTQIQMQKAYDEKKRAFNRHDEKSVGIHTKMIKASPMQAEEQLREFYERMYACPTFKVVSQSQAAFPMGQCIYITYTIS